jgi:'Cold-shock' DNA-binding domain
MPEKVKGTVKWFSNRKGFGFVSPSAGGDDIFLHHSRIVSDAEYKTLVSEICGTWWLILLNSSSYETQRKMMRL